MTPTLRKRRSQVFNIALSASLIWSTLQPCVQRVAAQAKPDQMRAAAQNGETLFRAIYFLEGQTADDVPELKRLKSMDAYRRLNADQQKAIKAFQDSLVRDIRAAKPTFFDDFAKGMQSRDRTRISRTLGQASQTIRTTVLANNPAVARFLARNEASLRKGLVPVAQKEFGRDAGPDLRALNRTISKTAIAEADKTELTWLKGFTLGNQASDPDTDHSIAIALLTFVAVLVIVVIALPITADVGGGSLFHEQLVNSIATRR